MRKISIFLQLSLATLLLMTSCSTPQNIVYFQGLEDKAMVELPKAAPLRAQVEDELSIVVNSRDAELANLFNAVPTIYKTGFETGAVRANQEIGTYNVSTSGYIDFPVLGEIYVLGMTREEISRHIKKLLIEGDHIKDPIVNTNFVNVRVAITGEVVRPGRYTIDRDRVTIHEALIMAGDLSIHGRRDKITVIRHVDDQQFMYRLNLLEPESVYSSPAYYLQQNDLVYVEPSAVRLRQSKTNANNLRSTSFWITVGSLMTSVATLIINSLAK